MVVFSIVFWVYNNWFIAPEIIGGDWWYLHPSMVDSFSILPRFWSSQEAPLGGVNANFPFYTYAYLVIGTFSNTFGIPWSVVSKVFYFGLSLIIASFSINKLLVRSIKNIEIWQIGIGILIYCTNTYILLVASGGQMGIMLAYALAPFVLYRAIILIEEIAATKNPLISSVLLGLGLGLQMLFDIRICYLTIIACLLFTTIHFVLYRQNIRKLIKWLALSGLISFLLHAFWIIPFWFFHLLTVPTGITSTESFDFFSFADFENPFGLMHPNWPENIFGKTYFMRWEFLLIPIVAFSSLLFPGGLYKKSENKLYVIFFAVLVIVGTFFAKGTNEPWGSANKWIYEVVPGMNLFRDPTKFYVLVALAFSILVPVGIKTLFHLLSKKVVKEVPIEIGGILFILFWLVLLKPLWSPGLGGTFTDHQVPELYVKLAEALESEGDFSRTMWVPTQSRYRFQSELHPVLTSSSLLRPKNDDDHVTMLLNVQVKNWLDNLSIKYVILPDDSEGEIFLTDRVYDESVREKYERALDTIPWLTKIQGTSLDIYENKSFKPHLSTANNTDFKWKRNSSSEYVFDVNSKDDTAIYFSEGYHSGWRAYINSSVIFPEETEYRTMLFKIPKGQYEGKIVFYPERYSHYGFIISFITVAICLYFILKRKP